MDTPTYIILFALFCVVAVGFLSRSLAAKVYFISVVWIATTLCGEFLFAWAGNATCSKYLGCVTGFAGYDAFEHLFSGVAVALFIVWLCRRYPAYSILPDEPWKAALVIVAAVALVSVAWEILEFAHDAIRLDLFHEPLRNVRFHINLLDQPSNTDTMGDLSFNLLGAIVGVLFQSKNFRR
jgi:hypothetical protein